MQIKVLWPRSGGPEIQLHPKITVISGLLPAERIELVSTAHSLAIGDAPVWDGIVDVEGVEATLDEVGERFGKTADAALILTADRIIDSESDSRDHLRERRDDIVEQLSSAETLTLERHARVTAAQGNIDSDAFHKLDEADGVLLHAAKVAGRPDPWTDMSGVGERITQLNVTVAGIDDKIAKLPSGNRVDLVARTSTAKVAVSNSDEPMPQAAQMSEELAVLHAQRNDIEVKFRFLGFDVVAARARLESARAALKTAEEDAIPRPVGEREATAIERAHDELLSERKRATAGMRRGSARKRMEELQAELDSLLETIGYDTWSQYRMGNGEVQITPDCLRTYERSVVEVERATSELDEIAMRMDSDSSFAMIDVALGELINAAQRLLGRSPGSTTDIGRLRRDLDEVRIDAFSSTLSPAETGENLINELDKCGSPTHGQLESIEALVVLGESWLAVLRDADGARMRLAHDRRRCISEMEALEALGDASRVDRLERQRRNVRDAEVEMRRSADAMCALVDARIELHVVRATRLSLAEEHDQIVDQLDDPVIRGEAGPLPIVVIDSEGSEASRDAILDLADSAQVIMVTDAESTIHWANSLGPDCAGVIRRGAGA